MMDDYTPQINQDGGSWSESEILGNRAIVKVSASTTTLTLIQSNSDIKKIPLKLLDDPLSTLTNAQRNAIKNEILDEGYTLNEIDTKIPVLSEVTLRDVLKFMTTRKKYPRWDSVNKVMIFDGVDKKCRDITYIDEAVKE
jgi:hypothetical protein